MDRTAPPDLGHVRRIYVRAPNWVGDLVMATGSFARLRAAFPSAHIVGAMRPFLQPLLRGTGFFDAMLEAPKGGGLRGLWRQVAAVRAGAFDLAVVLPNSPATGLVPLLAGVPLRLGYRQDRPGMMNLGLRVPLRRRWFQRRLGARRWPRPMPLYYQDLLDVLGLPPASIHPRLAVGGDEEQRLDDYLRHKGVDPRAPLLVLVVGANYGASKLWLPERFAAVGRYFEQRGFRAVVSVGPAEAELGRQIAAAGGIVALAEPPLPLDLLRALVARSALMVTGDTGPRHLAVAFDRPVVCLMGPSDPDYTNYCLERQVVIRKDLECSPCQRKVCPLGHHRCMRDISFEEVVAAAEGLLRTN